MIDIIMMIMLKTTKNAQHVLSSDFFDQGKTALQHGLMILITQMNHWVTESVMLTI